jgi:hypothetical protein
LIDSDTFLTIQKQQTADGQDYMNLSQLNVSDLYVGMRLISAIGTPGTLVGITPRRNDGSYEGDHGLRIKWDNGKESAQAHYLLDRVEIAP